MSESTFNVNGDAGGLSRVLLKLKRCSDSINIPRYATEGSAGLDIEANEDILIHPMGRAAVGTGLFISIPRGYEVQLRPRSGLALRHGITLLNSPATIDSDYRGEISVILVNLGHEDFQVLRRMRIAQMVLSKIAIANICVVEGDLDVTERNTGGLGSTGLFKIGDKV